MHSALLSLFAIAIALFSQITIVVALPQFTLMSGNRCMNCHVNAQGGGIRNELGWYSMNEVSLINPATLGLDGFYSSLPKSNLLLDERLTLGFDVRVQTSRSIDSGSTRKYFPMQVAAHAAYEVADWMRVEGTYNAGPLRYPGQTAYSASVHVKPDSGWPQLRVGHFQPALGIRYDDHSMLIRQIADNTAYASPLIAPNYAALGAEVTYYEQQWFSVSAGVFSPSSLSEVHINNLPIASRSTPLYSANVTLSDHNLFTPLTNSYASASVLLQPDMHIISFAAGVGIEDVLSIMGERLTGSFGMATVENHILSLGVVVMDGIMLEVRAEDARMRSTSPTVYENHVTQFVFGAQIWLLPYLELRPDYRIVRTDQSPRFADQYAANRWNMQLHLFF